MVSEISEMLIPLSFMAALNWFCVYFFNPFSLPLKIFH